MTRKELKNKIRKAKRLHQITKSVYRHRQTYLKGVKHLGKSALRLWKAG